MTKKPFVAKARRFLHLRPSTTVGSLFGKNQKEKKSVKAKLKKILHLGRRVGPRDVFTSKSLIQVKIDPEPAGRIALDLCRVVMGSFSSNEQNENKARNSPGSEVDPLGQAFPQALTAIDQRLAAQQGNPNRGLARRRVNEERRLIAAKFPMDPIPQSPQKITKSRVTASPDHESANLHDLIDFSTTPPGSPPKAKNVNISTPRRHMVDENGDDVTDGHPYFSTFRQDTCIDNILSRSYQSHSISGSSHDELGEAEASSSSVNSVETDKQPTPGMNTSDAFWNPGETSALTRNGIGKPCGGLWAKLAAAKYGVEVSPDQDSAPKYELLSAEHVQAARIELQTSLDEDSAAKHEPWSSPDQDPGAKYDSVFAKLVQAEKNKLQKLLDQDPAVKNETPNSLVQYSDLTAGGASVTSSKIVPSASKGDDNLSNSIWRGKLAQLAANLEGLSPDQIRAAKMELLNSVDQAPEASRKMLSSPDADSEVRTSVVYATPKETGKSARERGDDPSRLLLRRLASKYKMPNEKMLKSPDHDPFRDSGYVTPFKPDDKKSTDLQSLGASEPLVMPKTPSKIESATTVENLSLALVPSNHSRLSVQPLSPNDLDNLTIDFANRAIKYLDLGLDYMVEQSNLELDAQQKDRKNAYSNQIPVNISEILSRVALMRPHMQGTPAVSRSRDFEAPAAAFEIDDRIFLNFPEKEKACALRIGVGKDGRVAYYLNLMVPVRRFDGRTEKLTIVSQMDVTSVVERLALQEYHARPKPKSAKPLKIEPDNWFEQSFHIEAILKRALTDTDIDFTEKSIGPPSAQMRRLLTFFLKLGSEHQECAVFAGKKPPGWENTHWQAYWITRDVRENELDDNPMYEKKIDEYMWSQIQYKLDDDWESFRWRETISWGKDGEQRGAYFIPMADRWSIGEEERQKWWLMFLSDSDEDAWTTERFV